MSNGNKELILSVRDRTGAWNIIEEKKGNLTAPKEFRTESAAQREGSMMLNEGKIDAFKVYRLLAVHH